MTQTTRDVNTTDSLDNPQYNPFDGGYLKYLETLFFVKEKHVRVLPLHHVKNNGECSCGLPHCNSKGKHPLWQLAPHGFLDATNDPKKIAEWFEQAPNCNVGVATGGHLIVIDVDGPVGEATLQGLEERLGALPDTHEVETGKGRHLYFAKNPAIILSNERPTDWKNIDVRADKGYVLMAGSNHYTGKTYRAIDWEKPFTALPQLWLDALIAVQKDKPQKDVTPLGKSVTITGSVSEGGRNEFLSGKAFALRKLGLDGEPLFNAVNAFNQKDCAPALPDAEVWQIVRGKSKIQPDPIIAPLTAPITPTNTPRISTLADLLSREIPPTNWIIPEFLPSGLVILGGKSKAGKSWFALNLCLSIAEGRLCFGEFSCTPRKILYLALEDNDRRLQFRANKLLETPNISQNFMFATQWPRFAGPTDKVNGPEGLSELSQLLLTQDLKLVVIDTWQKVRPVKRGFVDDYERDYQHLAQLQELASHCNAAIILVHHARKDNEGGEKQDSLLGSTAIAGAPDLIWILERRHGASEGVLTPSGRDIEDETPIVMDFDSGKWRYRGLKNDVDRTANQQAVLGVLRNEGRPMSNSELIRLSGVKKGSINKAINSLIEEKLVEYDSNYKCYQCIETCRQVDK